MSSPRPVIVSSSTESVRLFERDWMEALSKVHWSVPLLVYVPVALWIGARALAEGLSVPGLAALLGTGLAAWTLIEYLLHRYVFHYHPKSPWGIKLHFIIHGVHHDYPNDAKRLVMPPTASLPIVLAVYALLSTVLRPAIRDASFVGLLSGYLIYDMMHYALHHARFRSVSLQALRRHHMRHHFLEPNRRYGVSSPLWDWVFGTLPRASANSRAASR